VGFSPSLGFIPGHFVKFIVCKVVWASSLSEHFAFHHKSCPLLLLLKCATGLYILGGYGRHPTYVQEVYSGLTVDG
jgi:hypothetical protein